MASMMISELSQSYAVNAVLLLIHTADGQFGCSQVLSDRTCLEARPPIGGAYGQPRAHFTHAPWGFTQLAHPPGSVSSNRNTVGKC
jgi:hypothetical protein